jgi:hypothetical protein
MTQTNEFLDVLKQNNPPPRPDWDATMKILRDFCTGVEQFVSGNLKCRLIPGYTVNMGREYKPTVETPNGSTYILLRLYVPEDGLPVVVNPYSDDLINCDTHQMLRDELKKFLSQPSLKAMLLGMTP